MPLTLCGLATCTDAYLRLADAGPLFAARSCQPVQLAKALQWRAANGVGGELFFDKEWLHPDLLPRPLPGTTKSNHWFRRHLPRRHLVSQLEPRNRNL